TVGHKRKPVVASHLSLDLIVSFLVRDANGSTVDRLDRYPCLERYAVVCALLFSTWEPGGAITNDSSNRLSRVTRVQPVRCITPERVPVVRSKEAEMADGATAELARVDLDPLRPSAGEG